MGSIQASILHVKPKRINPNLDPKNCLNAKYAAKKVAKNIADNVNQ